ncbi:outer membrane protein [Bordetella sp. 15P40C-2]|uniref:outer membrane protein n=1 Tax=Bordetella sp. 15P40C-2 TaxID=2572246 RepID=UPI001323CE4A|nr:porin family protein [Bordetella sp. 15P40C-2]MVW72090.1 outer membrane beta-barrel protein [Bordetella sp. 15P40C-2]
MQTPLYKLSSFLVCGAIFSTPGVAAQPQSPDDDAWRFQVTPYVWMTGLDGTVRPFQGAPTAHVDKSFSEILDSLDAAFFLAGTARKDRWVVQGDLTYAATSDSAALPYGLSARAKVRQTSATLLGGYSWEVGHQSNLDVMAGARYWDINAKVKVGNLLSATSDTSFIDPIVALRWRNDFAPRWSSLVYVDTGGFGAGSDYTWQVMGSINYQVHDHVHLSVGYRHLDVNYRDGGKRLDFSQSGPLVGLTFRF